MFIPKRHPIPRRNSATPAGFIPSKRVSNVVPLESINTVPELQSLRSRTLEHLQICPPSMMEQLKSRIAEIDTRIEMLGVETNMDNMGLEDQKRAMITPRSPISVNSRNGSGDVFTDQAVSPSMFTPIDVDSILNDVGPSSSKPASPTSPVATKARVVAQPVVPPSAKRKSGKGVQMMSLEETIIREGHEHERLEAERLRLEARRLHKLALLPPNGPGSGGLTDEERKARILAFMNYKADSDDEDEDEEDDDDLQFTYDYEGDDSMVCSDDEGDDGEQPDQNDAMDTELLASMIRVDPNRIR
ncbi:hypothetical protein FRC03_008659 [Tulasnella sp. 419]|nr:hypothetical protein FRC02_000293 [Tulasnella sp. 418]KAG8968099.1 hypothetical protein FRC03_008659 [Tulasnella sp. 419]